MEHHASEKVDIGSESVADPGGARESIGGSRGAMDVSPGPKSFILMQYLVQNVQNNIHLNFVTHPSTYQSFPLLRKLNYQCVGLDFSLPSHSSPSLSSGHSHEHVSPLITVFPPVKHVTSAHGSVSVRDKGKIKLDCNC